MSATRRRIPRIVAMAVMRRSFIDMIPSRMDGFNGPPKACRMRILPDDLSAVNALPAPCGELG